jgi:putative SOS response-associated peptidase YedK
MYNLYSITTNQAAIISLFRAINHNVGNLPPMPGVLPDYPAAVVRKFGDDREMVMMRWGKATAAAYGARARSSAGTSYIKQGTPI